jgi:hypothetical protein
MADVKISELPVASAVSDSDIVVINQGGTTKTAARSLVKNAGTVTSVTAGTGLSGGTITGSGTVALVTPVAVANGGTGVAASSGANSVVLRDASKNISVNSAIEGFTSLAASVTPLVLTVASTPSYLVTGSGGQTIKLPDATTLQNGVVYLFNNNQSSGAISVNNNSDTLIASIPSGGFTAVSLLSNSIAAGSWERHEQAPSNVTWSTNTLDYPGSITSATWNGNAVAINRGGTGASTQQDALNNISGTQTAGYHFRSDGTNVSLQPMSVADVTAGTLAVANGGTGAANGDDAATNLGFPAQVRPVSSLVTLAAGTNAAYAFTASTTVPSFVSSSIISEGELINCNSATNTQNVGPWIVTTTGYQAKFVASISAGSSSMNVTSVISGTLAVGQTIVIPSVTNSVTIVSLGTGTGGTGTYNLSASPSAAAQTAVTMASGTGIAPVYTRPTWFRGTLTAAAYYFQVTKSTTSGNSQGNLSQIFPTTATDSLPVVTANGSLGTSFSSILIAQRTQNAIIGSNTYSGTQTFVPGTVTVPPLKFQNGVLLTTPVAHSVEWDSTSMYLTTSAGARTTNVVNTVVPSTSTSAGAVGQIAVDNTNNWLYVCTAANVWKRVALTTF